MKTIAQVIILMTVIGISALVRGADLINYEEEIEVFQLWSHCSRPCIECRDDYSEITSPPALIQVDLLQLCVTTVSGSAFGVHSIKELDVSQLDDTPDFFSYVNRFVDSPLAETMCKEEAKNTTNAICKTKIQLLTNYFDNFGDPAYMIGLI